VIGKVTTISGSMFSGKSTLLTKKIREAKRVPSFHVMVFKPLVDNRYSLHQVVTHDQESEDCTVISNPEAIITHFINAKTAEPFKNIIVFIDEAQFFDKSIWFVVQRLIHYGAIEVVCAGLDIDRFGEPFGAMPNLMAIADENIKLKTKCSCGNDSYISYGTLAGGQVKVGSSEYEPICRGCWYERLRIEDSKMGGEE
jgi:thymidine kinase